MSQRIGMIGLDTSHVPAFAKMLNNPSDLNHVPGGRIVAAFPGGSDDVELSRNRVPGYTQQLQADFGVQIVDTPEAVAEASDIVFLMSIDGRVHLDQLRRTLPFRRPTFIDKPMAHSTADATEMFRLAREAGVPLMSCSSLRYSDALIDLLQDEALGPIIGCDAFGPCDELPMPPGLFWYGIHTAEIIFRTMGQGCQSVSASYHPDGEVLVGTWSDGRKATLRGLRKSHKSFGITIHREKGFQQGNLSKTRKPPYHVMIAAIMEALPNGRSAIDESETLQIIRFLEAGNESRKTGREVAL